MIRINEELLDTLGIQLSDDEKPAFMEHIQQEIEARAGLAIADLLDDDELTELIKLQSNGDSKAVTTWIETTLPDIKDIIQDEFNLLIGEVVANT